MILMLRLSFVRIGDDIMISEEEVKKHTQALGQYCADRESRDPDNCCTGCRLEDFCTSSGVRMSEFIYEG